MNKLWTVSLLVTMTLGCAHNRSESTWSEAAKDEGSSTLRDIGSFRLSDPEGPKVVDQELESIPTEINPSVEKWLAYFQGRGRPHMERYLARSTRYELLMKKVLRDNGLPEDLFYIALIESGFSSKATSHASAVGYWQFIRGTGKHYGLQINAFVDERRDPVLATQAAADYFKGLYSVFGSWYLAMASYNVGENRVKREVMNNYTRDFWELARKKRLPRETIEYVPKFLAAKLIGKDPAKYGFGDIDYLPPIEFDHITVVQPVNLRMMADKMNLNYEDFKALNPKFKGEVAPVKGKDLVLRIPPGTNAQAMLAANESFVQTVQFVADSGETQTYRIKQGDTLGSIARRYRTTVAYLRDLNDLSKKKHLRIGMKIQVPDRTPLKSRSGQMQASSPKSSSTAKPVREVSSTSSSSGARVYVVQSGDSLFTIAKKYATSVAELKRINNIKNGNTLKVGAKIKLPGGDTTTQQSRTPAKKVHVVKRGENLSVIASKYNIAIGELKTANNIRNPATLFVGARLVIPGLARE